MSGDDDLEKLREVMKVLGDSLPNLMKGLADLSYDPKRVAAFATSTAEFYKQLREAGVPEDKAAELTKTFMDKANLGGPLQALFGSGGGDLGELGEWISSATKGPGKVVFKVGSDEDEEEESSSKKAGGGGSSGGKGRD